MKYSLHLLAAAIALFGWFRTPPASAAMTTTFVVVALAVLTLQIVITHRDSNKSEKLARDVTHLRRVLDRRPVLQISLNGKMLKHNDAVEIARTGSIFPIEFMVRNVGQDTAEQLQVQFQAPDFLNDLALGRHWKDHGLIGKTFNTQLQREVPIRQVSFIAPAAIHPNNFMTLGHGTTSGINAGTDTVLVKIRLSCSGHAETVYDIAVAFV